MHDYVEQSGLKECKCDEPDCAKCLLVNCQDESCKVHTSENKKRFRVSYQKR